MTDVPYDPGKYPPFAVTSDIVLFTIEDGALKVLLIKRKGEPFSGAWALPGGFVRPDEDPGEAAVRELAEETGLLEGSWLLEQLAAYGAPDRDPRMRVVTIAHWGVCAGMPARRSGGDASATCLQPAERIRNGAISLAFDHELIVRDAVEQIRSRMEHTALAAGFCPPEFTIRELRQVYETVWETRLDPGNFQRYVRESGAFEQCAAPAVRRIRSLGDSGDGMYFSKALRPGRPATLWTMKRAEDGRPATAARTLARPGRRTRMSR